MLGGIYMLFEGNICKVRDTLISEIKKGCVSHLVDDITTEEFIYNTRLILDLLEELEVRINNDELDLKIAVYENPMGSLYYEEVE